MMDTQQLLQSAKSVLKQNDCGRWTRPAPGLYPHQWLWDSCFIAIGLSHYSTNRAQTEILSLLRGQWKNGMIPHMIFSGSTHYYAGPHIWRSSKVSVNAPRKIETSGITQPPVIAEAVVRVGKHLKSKERKEFYRKVYPDLLRYHQWLYRERDPHHDGLVVLVHPWETGLDNTPPWVEEMRTNQMPLWIRLVDIFKLHHIFELFRQDTLLVPAAERISTIESLDLFTVLRRLRRKKYDSAMILRRSHFSVNDLFFNSILIRNNHLLEDIAREIDRTIPKDLKHTFQMAQDALERLWDAEDGKYYSRNYITQEFIKTDSIAGLMPLYSGVITKQRAKQLVERMKENYGYWKRYPVPSAPKNSKYFNQHRYWQGPTWVNTNWLLIDGLRQYGYEEEAEYLKKKTLTLVSNIGFFEYFSPIDGSGAGILPFSWSAALTIDLLSE